ncbi:MAG TPA: hypothetical protein VJ903_02445, partial [Clostridia bacterium]|nr:hypothetical protein [Clostridia bacterium]
MRKHTLFKILILVLSIALMVGLAACSERPIEKENDGTELVERPPATGRLVAVSKATAWDYISKSISNMDSTIYTDPEWFNVDFGINFELTQYQKVGEVYSKIIQKQTLYSATVKANINLKDNNKSNVFIELKDVYKNLVKIGVYYFQSTLYLNIGGKKMYTEQLNMATIGKLIADTLNEKDIDIVKFVGHCLHGQIDIDAIANYVSLAWGILFDNNNCIVEYSADEKYQYINQHLKLDFIMGMITSGRINLAGIVDIVISWEAFGLPNLDGLMEKLFGFSLASIIAKDWPSMTTALYAVTQLGTVNRADLTQKQDYIFNGFGLDIVTDTGEFDFNFQVTPFKLSTSNKDNVSIKFEGFNFGDSGKGTTYTEGSLTNLEFNGVLDIANTKPGEQITLNSILGNLLGDLGAVGNIPLELGDATNYRFDINVALALDLFNNENNRAKIGISYNNIEIVGVYLVPNLALNQGETVLMCTAYIDTHNLTSGGKPLVPQLRLTNINLTKILAGDSQMPGLLSEFMKYIDPYYANTTSATRANNAAAEGEEEKSSFDIMKLIKILVTTNSSDPQDFKYLHFPEGDDTNFSVDLDNYALNNIISLFIPNTNVGLESVSIGFDTAAIFNSIKLKVNVTDSLSLSLGIGEQMADGSYSTGLGYFVEPDMDLRAVGIDYNGEAMENAENLRANYKDISGELKYGATLEGSIVLDTNQSDGGIDLSGLVGAFVENAFVSLGIGHQTDPLPIKYKIQIGLNLLRFSDLSLLIDLYVDDEVMFAADPNYNLTHTYPFMSIFFSGADDDLYIDTEPRASDETGKKYDLVTQLKDIFPLLNVVDGALPKLFVPDIGLKAMLGGMGLDLSSIASILGVSNASFNLFENASTTDEGTIDIGEEESSINILKLIGDAIDGILVNDDVLSIIINSEVLNVVAGLAGIDFSSSLPKVNANLKLHLGTKWLRDENGAVLYKYTDKMVDGEFLLDEYGNRQQTAQLEDSEYLKIHLGILDSNNNDIEVITLDLCLIDTLTIKKGNEMSFAGAFIPSDYISLSEYVKDLVISVNTEITLTVSADEEIYIPEQINEYLALLLKGDNESDEGTLQDILKAIALQIDNEYWYDTGLKLGIALKGNINIGDLFKSDISLVIFDRSSQVNSGYRAFDNLIYQIIVGIYITNDVAYVDLSYLGINPISITQLKGSYNGAMATLWDNMYKETEYTDGDEEIYYQSKRDLLDMVYNDTVLQYFMDTFYATNARAKKYRTENYKYIVHENTSETPNDTDTLVYVYFKEALDYYFTYDERSNELIIEEGYTYNWSGENLIINKKNSTTGLYEYYATIEPTKDSDIVVTFDVDELEEERITNQRLANDLLGIVDTDLDILFSNIIKATAYSNYNDLVAEYGVIWDATYGSPNTPSDVKTLMTTKMGDGKNRSIDTNGDYIIESTSDEIFAFEEAIYINSNAYKTLERNTGAELAAHMKRDTANGFGGIYRDMPTYEIRQTQEYKDLYLERLEAALKAEVQKKYDARGVSAAELKAVTYYRIKNMALISSNVVVKANNSSAHNVVEIKDSIDEYKNQLTPVQNGSDVIRYNANAAISNSIPLILELQYNAHAITLALSEATISSILTIVGMEKIADLFKINELALAIDLNNGLDIDLSVKLEDIYTITVGIGNLRVSLDETKRNNYKPIINTDDYNQNTDGVPDGIYVEASLDLNIKNELIDNESERNTYDFTKALSQIFSNSTFTRAELGLILDEAVADSSSSASEKAIKAAAWDTLGALLEANKEIDPLYDKKIQEKQSRYDAAETTIRNNLDKKPEYSSATLGDDTYKALAWDNLVEGAMIVDLDEIGMRIMAEFIGEQDASLSFHIQAWLDFSNIYKSVFKITITRIILNQETGELDSNVVMTVIYDGSNAGENDKTLTGDIYISTQLFGIGNVVIKNFNSVIQGIFDIFDNTFVTDLLDTTFIKDITTIIDKVGAEEIDDVEVPTGQNSSSDPYIRNAAPPSARAFIQLMLKDGNIKVGLAKSTVVEVIKLFGLDLTEAFSEMEFGMEAYVKFKQELTLGAKIYLDQAGNVVGEEESYATEMGIEIGKINIGFDKQAIEVVEAVEENGDTSYYYEGNLVKEGYDEVEQLTNVGISLSGVTAFELIFDKDSTTSIYNFDYVVSMFTKYWLDNRDPEIGMQLQMENSDIFSQATYFSISANV